ncbi:Nif11-like leader peptide family natural product precursor [Chlorobium sp. N1]|nr:Nif11-like leader peptide family natural product precursor [Chlorobium sp. N1]
MMQTDEAFKKKVMAIEDAEGRMACINSEGYDCTEDEIHDAGLGGRGGRMRLGATGGHLPIFLADFCGGVPTSNPQLTHGCHRHCLHARNQASDSSARPSDPGAAVHRSGTRRIPWPRGGRRALLDLRPTMRLIGRSSRPDRPERPAAGGHPP